MINNRNSSLKWIQDDEMSCLPIKRRFKFSGFQDWLICLLSVHNKDPGPFCLQTLPCCRLHHHSGTRKLQLSQGHSHTARFSYGNGTWAFFLGMWILWSWNSDFLLSRIWSHAPVNMGMKFSWLPSPMSLGWHECWGVNQCPEHLLYLPYKHQILLHTE